MQARSLILGRESLGSLSEPQHTLSYSVFLHLGPGIMITLFYLLMVPVVMARGLPPMFALLLAILFVAIPAELGDLLRRGQLYNQQFSLTGVIGYRSPIRWWSYVVFTVGFLFLAAVISALTGLLEIPLAHWMEKFFPSWFFLNQLEQYAGYGHRALILTLITNLFLNGLAAPCVEELYFRGYLLPRLAHFGGWAPLINTVLFTIYHFWQPYSYLSIGLVILPLVYLVWWKQNVYLGIMVHCALNIVGNLLLFAAVLKS